MKKTYEAPKVEKMAFNYSDAVVASGNGCHWQAEYGWETEECESDKWGGHWVGNILS